MDPRITGTGITFEELIDTAKEIMDMSENEKKASIEELQEYERILASKIS